MPTKAQYEKHREYYLQYNRTYYVAHRSEALERSRKNVRYGNSIYVCVVDVCPKCGRKGYKHYTRQKNIKTGMFRKWRTIVCHFRYVGVVNGKRKTVYDGCCYVGMGKL